MRSALETVLHGHGLATCAKREQKTECCTIYKYLNCNSISLTFKSVLFRVLNWLDDDDTVGGSQLPPVEMFERAKQELLLRLVD